MNKTAIRNYAVWARSKLIADIEYKAGLMGITENGIASALPQSTNEVQFFDIGTKDYASIRGREINQRNALISAIRAKEKESDYKKAFLFVVEKVAYTWFNRLVAIRFMEVNDYLPSRVRVLSSENENKAEPDMVTSPFDTDMSFSQQEEDLILKLKDENRLNELFRWLFIKQCHKLHDVLPLLFSPEMLSSNQNDYFELLLTISFTDKDGVLWHLVHDIREQDFRIRTPEDDERQRIENIAEEDMPAGQVEIIGWMYQYYNTEPKDQVFADLKKNIKISKDKIPAATQLFTPDWIVRYMIENSLGRLWVEGHPNEELKKNWKYYLEEAEQEPEVQKQLTEIRKGYGALRPEEIKVIDPCMGSGHILVYLFEVLMQIYESQGWTQREAAQSIVQNNLYGLDIDERAAQLAYFAVMMKARQYDRRFLERGLEPHVYEIQESNQIDSNVIDYFVNGNMKLKADIITLISELRDAKEYGSALKVTLVDFSAIYSRIETIKEEGNIFSLMAHDILLPLVKRGEALAQKYDVVCTNPPYMSARGSMSATLTRFLTKNYPLSKNDMFTVFMEVCQAMAKKNGFYAMVNQQSWMFLSGFAKLREKLYSSVSFVNMVHIGAGAFEGVAGEVVQSVAFSIRHRNMSEYKSLFLDETDGKWHECIDGIPKTLHFYAMSISEIQDIPNGILCYQLGGAAIRQYYNGKRLDSFADPRVGMATGDNDLFVRLWQEVDFTNVGIGIKNGSETIERNERWYPYNKGGECRRWYGNRTHLVDWYHNGSTITAFKQDRLMRGEIEKKNSECWNREYYFLESISWSKVSSGRFAVRYYEPGFIFDVAGCSILGLGDYLLYVMGALNSELRNAYIESLSPTLNFETGAIKAFPVIVDKNRKFEIEELVRKCIQIEKEDWDSFEGSWDFSRHPLIRIKGTISDAYSIWKAKCDQRITDIKAYEEQLNRVFIAIYNLEDELIPDVEINDVTVRCAVLERDIRSLISYAVGCMFGRYSLNVDGLAYAGGTWDISKYTTFIPDEDNCIPITDEPYFEDDIVGRFVEFIRIVYGDRTLEENLDFIARALGKKGNSSREIIRNYFLEDFFKDHCSFYSVTGSGKRPVYWLFDSGKQNGFKALVYMHRWNADTIGNLRVEYLHRMQRVYEKEITRMQDVIDNSHDNREINQATKRREKLVKQLKEARDYDAKIAHAALSRVEIDLDDGVKVNYEKVQRGPDGKSLGILAKI